MSNLVLECKAVMLNNDVDISRILIYIQQVMDEKKKQLEIGQR